MKEEIINYTRRRKRGEYKSQHLTQREFRHWNLRILRVFFESHGGFDFLINVKNAEEKELRICSANTERGRNLFLTFLTPFNKNTGHMVTKIGPVCRISNFYKSYFMKKILGRNFFEVFLSYTLFQASLVERVNWYSG